mmetsp:Transcript_64032/g.113896  ORF Transcript_64032/g.113896 Transcript_64032/m.113896 type:complete len:216 (-) Transcript_64032:392-1039(-)
MNNQNVATLKHALQSEVRLKNQHCSSLGSVAWPSHGFAWKFILEIPFDCPWRVLIQAEVGNEHCESGVPVCSCAQNWPHLEPTSSEFHVEEGSALLQVSIAYKIAREPPLCHWLTTLHVSKLELRRIHKLCFLSLPLLLCIRILDSVIVTDTSACDEDFQQEAPAITPSPRLDESFLVDAPLHDPPPATISHAPRCSLEVILIRPLTNLGLLKET